MTDDEKQTDGRVIPEISVGSVAIAKRSSGVCDPGDLGVCYEVYELDGRPGYSFIFERGRYDGFSPEDVELFLFICFTEPSIAGYEFTNVLQLVRDFCAGRFAAAFPVQASCA